MVSSRGSVFSGSSFTRFIYSTYHFRSLLLFRFIHYRVFFSKIYSEPSLPVTWVGQLVNTGRIYGPLLPIARFPFSLSRSLSEPGRVFTIPWIWSINFSSRPERSLVLIPEDPEKDSDLGLDIGAAWRYAKEIFEL